MLMGCWTMAANAGRWEGEQGRAGQAWAHRQSWVLPGLFSSLDRMSRTSELCSGREPVTLCAAVHPVSHQFNLDFSLEVTESHNHPVGRDC